MKVGDTLEVEVERLASGGDGVAHAPDGRVVFIPFAAPGDRLTVQLDAVRPRFARARIERIDAPGEGRTEPPCPVFGRCGGCRWQHLDQELQEAAKAQIVVDALARIGGIEPPEEVPVHGAEPYGYRERARLRVRAGQVGFLQEGSHELCAIGSCPVLAPPLDEVLGALAADAGPDREVELTLSDDGEVALREVSPGARTGPASVHVVGEDRIRTPAGAFVQANGLLRAELAACVHGHAGSGEVAIELHAGSGLFTLGLARRFARLTAVEADSSALQGLGENLAAAGLSALRVEASVETWLAAEAEREHPDAVVLDPPRTGLGAASAERLAALGAARIVYVSCDPATLARDLKPIVAAGYELAALDVFDCFPQTAHVETVVRMERPAGRDGAARG